MKKTIISLSIIILITFFLGEISFRFFKPMPTHSNLKKQAGGFYKKGIQYLYSIRKLFW